LSVAHFAVDNGTARKFTHFASTEVFIARAVNVVLTQRIVLLGEFAYGTLVRDARRHQGFHRDSSVVGIARGCVVVIESLTSRAVESAFAVQTGEAITLHLFLVVQKRAIDRAIVGQIDHGFSVNGGARNTVSSSTTHVRDVDEVCLVSEREWRTDLESGNVAELASPSIVAQTHSVAHALSVIVTLRESRKGLASALHTARVWRIGLSFPWTVAIAHVGVPIVPSVNARFVGMKGLIEDARHVRATIGGGVGDTDGVVWIGVGPEDKGVDKIIERDRANVAFISDKELNRTSVAFASIVRARHFEG
jgi:hypothetical protein